MHRSAVTFFASLLLGCAAEGPAALEFDVDEADREQAMGWVVPGATRTVEPETEPAEVTPTRPSHPETSPRRERVRPRLAFVWEWGEFAHAESCNFGVEFVGGPVVSEDGRYVLHDRKDAFWESDGGEGWQDYHDQEPVEEGGLALVDLHAGTTTWLGSVLEGEPPHRASGHLNCRKLRPLLKAGVERVNAEIPDTTWRPLVEAGDLGVRVLSDEDAPAELTRTGADRSPLELMLKRDTLILRQKGVEVLLREAVGPLEICNMPLLLTDARIDLETGFMLASVSKRCVCFGSESLQHFSLTLPERTRERVAQLAPSGRAVRDTEGW